MTQGCKTTNFTDPINIIPLLDLTSLNLDDTKTSIITLCNKAKTLSVNVAAVCVYPQFVKIVAEALKNTTIKIATVVNFPDGNQTLQDTIQSIEIALSDGANEIDMVFPYNDYLYGEKNKALDFVIKAKTVCENRATLKIIIESGELGSINLIKAITKDAILAGADFIKTSTGKTKQGATLEAASAILTMIKESGKVVGFKVSGGVSTISHSLKFIQLARDIMGNQWVKPSVFRIGTSKLLDEIMVVTEPAKPF